MFADEVNGDVGLLGGNSATAATSSLATQRQRLPRDTECPSSISSRRNWSRWGSRSDVVAARKTVFGFAVRPSPVVGGVAQVFEHLGDVVGDVVHALVEALQRDVPERLVKLAQPARLRVALEELVGHQAGVQRREGRRAARWPPPAS